MKSYKYKFLEKSILGQGIDLERPNPNLVIDKCINRAYRDMMTAGRFYIKCNINNICTKFKKILESHNYQFSQNLINDTLSLFGENEIIKNSKNKSYITRYGISQKLVNMSYKYFFLFEDYICKNINFSSCDCPLDSIILNSIQFKKTPWSKLTKEDYIICQNIIKDKLSKESLVEELQLIGNLAFDFLSW